MVGGATPASIVGDWLTSAFDQDNGEGITIHLEDETIAMLRQLFGLSDEHFGAFVSGATMSNFVGLATARQWAAQQMEVDIAQQGLYKCPEFTVYSSKPHSSIYKSLSMLGMGRESIKEIKSQTGSEAIDVSALEVKLKDQGEVPCIVVANAGTVNSTSFDDLAHIVSLKSTYNFWLHVDAAFGMFAACSPKYAHLVDGVDGADSIAVDAHKWLNVPYDSGIQFCRHPMLQRYVFQNSNAVYLGDYSGMTDYMDRTPETSRRLRALTVWFTLMAYGKKGYEEIIERNCKMAQHLSERIRTSSQFSLLTPTTFNVVCFTLNGHSKSITREEIVQFLDKLTKTGRVFMTPTVYNETPAIRAAICNWRTTGTDIEISWETLQETYDKL